MQNGKRVRVRVSGPYACFSRPEMKVERVSYEVMTPSAARGILDAILWRPEMRWVVHAIEILRPVRFISFRRNEVQSKIAPGTVKKWIKNPETFQPQLAGAGSEDATPRNTLALRDVAYVIEAEPRIFHPNAENTPMKYIGMFERRVENGQCFHRPYLGCREFACRFEPPVPKEEPEDVRLDLGIMLYDIICESQGSYKPVFFHASVSHGVMKVSPEAVLNNEKQREEMLACSYKR